MESLRFVLPQSEIPTHWYNVVAESHLAVHTWPELNAVTLDLYVCNFSQDNSAAARAACEQLIAAFAPGRVVRREIERGR